MTFLLATACRDCAGSRLAAQLGKKSRRQRGGGATLAGDLADHFGVALAAFAHRGHQPRQRTLLREARNAAQLAPYRLVVTHVRIADVDVAFEVDRKSTRLNSSHPSISYAVFCVKKKNVRNMGRRVVLERLALHHVAPVAGRVSDGEQDRLVLRLRAREGLLAPRVSVDGVLRRSE